MNAILLQPDPDTVAVSLHPRHESADVVSIRFSDAEHGGYLIAVSTELAEHLATLLATATKSPRIGAHADQLKAAQREGRQIRPSRAAPDRSHDL
ncbi:hypothetical protein [[Mycobacterium] holstebronense]|uniref:DUF2694 domain-containing protein n=1 Tax=[Mycobacterium] holstebronense TaxID=3064288 RepID=A0ABM9LSU7_9MYCO|nr:hypothetical protein [Mycolicibacter sp. MU0102]CAJ1504146.1 hypothetical protein MU0102_002171 [Mycolicibacter sp. MU0102]